MRTVILFILQCQTFINRMSTTYKEFLLKKCSKWYKLTNQKQIFIGINMTKGKLTIS